jgi:signal transduction histidine kinase
MPSVERSSESRLNVAEIDQDNHVLTVLYVEDESDSRVEFIEIIRLRYPELRLLVAENGKEGITAFKLNQPEIVVTDINMPHKNGIVMASEIRAMNPATEIIFLTAYSDTNYLMQAIEIGVSHFILKPTNVEQLFKVIDKVIASICSARLVTKKNIEIERLNTELATKAEQLELANRELEAFDYTLAHDLRSPMVTISCFSQLLLDGHASQLDDKGKGHLQKIVLEIRRLSRFVEALLKFSVKSRKQIEKKWTNLSEIVQQISAGLLAQETGRHATFCITDGIKAYCEPDLLHLVLENLVRNAWKYTAKVEEARIEFGTISTEQDLVYFVRDNGAGFDQEASEKLFSPFQRLHCDSDFEGIGIGLATSYRIILRHGGRIWGEGEKGVGATFYFTL